MEIAELKELKKYCKNNFKQLRLTSGKSVGCAASFELDKVKHSWEEMPTYLRSPWVGCYSGYLYDKKKKMARKSQDYYVAYPAMPEWFDEIVEDFNIFFDNIKIEVLESKPAYLTFESSVYKEWGSRRVSKIQGYEFNVISEKAQKKVCIPLVKFSYNKDYSPYAKFYFNYSVVIFLRMLSFHERFTNPFSKPRGNKINYIVKVNNANAGYRSFSEKIITAKEVKNMDNIKMVNEFAEKMDKYGSLVKQTDFIIGLNNRLNDLRSSNFTDFLKKYDEPKKKITAKRKTTARRNLCACVDCRIARGEKI